MRQMQFSELEIKGVFEISPFESKDNRGKLLKNYSNEIYNDNGINFSPIETLIIESKKNVLRGIHFQKEKGVDKLIQCIDGRIYCAIVNVDAKSDDFGKWISTEISANDEKIIYVPKTCAFGTYAIEDAKIICQNGERFYPEYDSGIVWNDRELSIQWPSDDPILSYKDNLLMTFKDFRDFSKNEQ